MHAARPKRWAPGWGRRLVRQVAPFVGVTAFVLALWVLHDWLRTQSYRQLVAAIAELPAGAVARAAALTTAGYLVMTGYDLLALRFAGRRIRWPAVAATSFIANALGNNFGNTLVTGGAVRYWSYTSAGLSAADIARVVVSCSVAFWLGFLFVGGVVFVSDPMLLPPPLNWIGATTRPLGVFFLALLAGYIVLAAVGRGRPIGALQLHLPSLPLTIGQIAIASLDLSLMAAAFHALLPPAAGIDLLRCIGVLLVAVVAGNLSLLPGGIGVFESAVVLLLGSSVSTSDLGAAMIVFRVTYFVAPLFAAVALLALRGGSTLVPVLRGRFAQASHSLTAHAPQMLAAMVFIAGAVLLFSGTLPATTGRLEALGRILSLPVIEASHFLASLSGAALLLLAHGLRRRLDAAWLVCLVLLALGAVLSMTKGLDYEEAILLGAAGAVLLASRRQFHRKSSLLGEPLSIRWMLAAAIVVAASAWLVHFSQRDALHAGQSWWDFALHAEASRALRATVGAASLAALLALSRLLRPVRPKLALPAAGDMELARRIAERSPRTYANLVLRGDKAVLFSAAQDAFLMYGCSGRSWIAMGDPVGAAEGARELRWRFRDLCDRYDRWCVFFEVQEERRSDYAQLGLGLTLLGEQARVDLTRFSIDPPMHGDLRQARAKLLRRQCRFEIVPRESVPNILAGLSLVSQAWLATKATREKGFSNASFDAGYLAQFPVAVVRCAGQIVAFANLWLGAGKEELSVDLMRHQPSAPNGTMDFLFCELMLWGRAQGFHWFDFGMAPLSGLQAQAGGGLWTRAGSLVYRHGEHFYNFEGLRRYKEKFAPVWRPLYLASPGGVALPAILVDVAALMAGGLPGIVSKHGTPAGTRT